MIPSLLRVYATLLRRDRMALVLTFLVPLAFFSVFAAVFGSMDQGARQPVRAAIHCADTSEHGVQLLENLRAVEGIELLELDAEAKPFEARERVRYGQVSVVIVVPEGFGGDLRFQDSDSVPQIDLFADTANPLALEVVRGAVQAAAYPLLAPHTEDGDPDGGGVPAAQEPAKDEPLHIAVVDVLGGGSGKKPSIAYFAAGIGVMFLLFVLSGTSAVLIDERESGVLLRMMTSRLTIPRLLAGRWLYLLLLGCLQVTLMFVWGAFAFGLDLFTPRHLAGFAVMTVTTAAAAAAFALLLAVACKTREQLNGTAVVLVLMMSALGGSMFPRFLMPEALQELGRYTFNAWALDGYRKVFWYEAGIPELVPELLVLGGTTLALFVCASVLARRWRHA